MTILDKIIIHKRKEVAANRVQFPIAMLEKSPGFQRTVFSLKQHLFQPEKPGIIAEFKRQSPSKGAINLNASVAKTTKGYIKAGASALSVLTDHHFFGGSNADLIEAREENNCPILRKDFVVDEYQLFEARAIGADAILLIAECLEPDEIRLLSKRAKDLGLEVLMELHGADQLEKITGHIDLVGVNNRNLHDFSVSLAASYELAEKIPATVVKISESGIDDPSAVVGLRRVGYRGFLMGEYFMRSDDPGELCREFIQRVNNIQNIMNGAIA